VNGVESVKVSLEKGLATVKFKAGNSVTLKQLQTAITKNGFTMKDSKIVAAGMLIQESGSVKFQISGSKDILSLVAEVSGTPPPVSFGSTVFLVEGTIQENSKGKTPDVLRYRSSTPENPQPKDKP
jgi:copper chaperone CopZ